jgi:short-subunit dehydrogenase
VLVKSAPILFVNSFARNLVLASVGAAILSWSHSELNRRRRLVPLPLPDQYQDISRAILPAFLPEEVPDVDIEILRSMEKQVEDDLPAKEVEESVAEGLSPRVRRHLQNIYQVAEQKPRTLRTTLRQWGRMRDLKRLEQAKVRRAGIVDELVALTALKKKATKRKKLHDLTTEDKEPVEPLGYALVTGASRGIGRAIAVELARWEIPLVLVARDVRRLTDLAIEIEMCYGVKCCVLQADLSEPGAAERVWATTNDAGLKVDILVNNAGVCSSGLSVDIPNSELQQMMQVNTISVAMLNHLYGRDMKDQGRGRILVVSSIVGSVEAGPTVACYAATKAFERSLAISMGKELEQHGVGVTCLMPGAVRDTSFRSNSQVDEALCWKLPFYTRPAPLVAHQGVVAMLNGDVQVVPGWQNRAFLKVFKPILPQRLTTIIVQMAWSPFQFSWPKLKFPTIPALTEKIPPNENDTEYKKLPTKWLADVPSLWPGTSSKPPPRLLKLPEEFKRVEEEAKENVPLDNSNALEAPAANRNTGDENRTSILVQPTVSDDLEHESRADPNVETTPLLEQLSPKRMEEGFAFDDYDDDEVD